MLRKELNLDEETKKKKEEWINDWPDINSKGAMQIVLFEHQLYRIHFRMIFVKQKKYTFYMSISR